MHRIKSRKMICGITCKPLREVKMKVNCDLHVGTNIAEFLFVRLCCHPVVKSGLQHFLFIFTSTSSMWVKSICCIHSFSPRIVFTITSEDGMYRLIHDIKLSHKYHMYQQTASKASTRQCCASSVSHFSNRWCIFFTQKEFKTQNCATEDHSYVVWCIRLQQNYHASLYIREYYPREIKRFRLSPSVTIVVKTSTGKDAF